MIACTVCGLEILERQDVVYGGALGDRPRHTAAFHREAAAAELAACTCFVHEAGDLVGCALHAATGCGLCGAWAAEADL